MPVNTGIALVGVAAQDDVKTPAEKPWFVHGLTGGSPFAFERTVGTLAVACGYRGNIAAHVEEINVNPTVSTLGYQEVLPLYAWAALGKIETAPGPKKGLYRHVITIGESLPYLTIFGQEGQEGAKGFGKTIGCKVNELELSFSDTDPLTMSPSLMGCDLERLFENPNAGFPPICYSGYFDPAGGEFAIDTAGRKPTTLVIQSGTWTITNDCDAVRDPTTRLPAYIQEKLSKAAVSFDAVPEDFEEFWKMVTGSSTATHPASHIVYGSYRAFFKHSENEDFTLTIEGDRVPFACEVPEVEPEGGTGIFTFSSEDSYVEKVGDSGITITVVNDVADYFDPASYALPANVPDPVGWGEVLPGIDAEQLGDFHISGRSKVISGTATRTLGGDGVEAGYYLPLALDDWEGATVSTKARSQSVPFKDGVATVFLGTEGIEVASVTVTDPEGEATTYELDVECSESMPAVKVVKATGEHYGADVSTFGTIEISNRSRTITGTSVSTTVPNFHGEGKPATGHFLSFDLDPREGTEVRMHRRGEWNDWKKTDSEPWVLLLGTDGIDADSVEVKAKDGTVESWTLDLKAPLLARAKRAVKVAAKKASE